MTNVVALRANAKRTTLSVLPGDDQRLGDGSLPGRPVIRAHGPGQACKPGTLCGPVGGTFRDSETYRRWRLRHRKTLRGLAFVERVFEVALESYRRSDGSNDVHMDYWAHEYSRARQHVVRVQEGWRKAMAQGEPLP